LQNRGRGRERRQLKFDKGAIATSNRYAQAVYGYDVRTEIIGSKGSILVGKPVSNPGYSAGAQGSTQPIADYFLSHIRRRIPGEIRDFVDTMLHDRSPRVGGEDGLKALAIAVAAERIPSAGTADESSARSFNG